MNLRTTGILFGLLVVSLLGFFLSQHFGLRTPEERKEYERWVLPTLNDKITPVKDEDFTRITVERPRDGGTERLEFERKDKDWRMVLPKNVKTDTAAVNRLLDQIKSAEKQKYIDLSTRLSQYGLDNPKTTVQVATKDKAYTLSFGEQGPGKDPMVYVVSSDIPATPMAVTRSKLDRVFAAVEEFRSKDLLSGSTFGVNSIRVAGANRKPLEFEKPEGKEWRFKEPKLGDADKKAVEDLLNGMTSIKVEKNEDFIADGDADLSKYGLAPDKASWTIAVQRKAADAKEPATETLLIGGRDASPAQAAKAAMAVASAGRSFAGVPLPGVALAAHSFSPPKATEDIGAYFAKLSNENSIVRIDAKKVTALEKKPDELRSRDLVEIDAVKADAINLTAKGETMRLRRADLKAAALPGGFGTAPPANWDMYTQRGKVKTHLNVVPNLIDALNKLELKDATAFLDDGEKQRAWFGGDAIDLGLDKPQAEVTVWLEGIQRDKEGKPEGDGEPKLKDAVKDKPAIKLALGRKDEKRGVVYVRRKVGDDPEAIIAVPDPWTPAAATPPPQFPGAQPTPPSGQPIHITSQLTAGYYAFRDHVLPSFSATDAVKLTYNRHGVNYVLEKEEKKDEKENPGSSEKPGFWNLKQPVAGKASPNADTFLHQLATLTADQMVTDKATEQDIKNYGLDKPLLKISVTAKDKDGKQNEYTCTIGNPADPKGPDANHYYARLEAKPAEGSPPEANQFVFLLKWIVVQGLDVELRDTTVIPEEKAAKPQSLILTWRSLDKDKKPQETRLELIAKAEKEGAEKSWTVQSLTRNGTDAKSELAKLDAGKVKDLLTPGGAFGSGPRLNPLVTERFVVHEGTPDAQRGLDPADKANPPVLMVDVTFDNKSKHTLILGNAWERKDEDYPGLRHKTYYRAASSQLPKAVFLLAEPDFKPLATGPEYFKTAEKSN